MIILSVNFREPKIFIIEVYSLFDRDSLRLEFSSRGNLDFGRLFQLWLNNPILQLRCD